MNKCDSARPYGCQTLEPFACRAARPPCRVQGYDVPMLLCSMYVRYLSCIFLDKLRDMSCRDPGSKMVPGLSTNNIVSGIGWLMPFFYGLSPWLPKKAGRYILVIDMAFECPRNKLQMELLPRHFHICFLNLR